MSPMEPDKPHKNEVHTDRAGSKLNWLRAAVLGANDGIVSLAALVVGVAAASGSSSVLLTVGIAGLTAGALSMALGEYVSVSSQRDIEKALIEKERHELHTEPDLELEELITLYHAKGLKHETARIVAHELTEHDVFAAHLDIELGIDPNHLVNPWQAALASAISFSVGAIIPLIAILLPPIAYRIPVTFAAVLVALIITGVVSAIAGGSGKMRSTVRVVVGGILAMAITLGMGRLFGVSGGAL